MEVRPDRARHARRAPPGCGEMPIAAEERLAVVLLFARRAPSRRAAHDADRELERTQASDRHDADVPPRLPHHRRADRIRPGRRACAAAGQTAGVREQRVDRRVHLVPAQRRAVLVHERRADERILVRVLAVGVRADPPRDLARGQVQVAILPRRVQRVRADEPRRDRLVVTRPARDPRTCGVTLPSANTRSVYGSNCDTPSSSQLSGERVGVATRRPSRAAREP